ncbi:MAG TPA: phosphate signaling complex protein PhoU [Tepidisphaeraceae bacterium]|jgi:phosphate transport system protein|nr:phosphate signaling complex protein PhoU [Tepidisphaeraceae bacterium]
MAINFTDQLETLQNRLARMSALVQQVVEQSVDSIVSCNERLAEQTIATDKRVDDEEVEIEKLAINLLALHQPTAIDLRIIMTVIKANSDLERIADCAVNCAQRVRPLVLEHNYRAPADLKLMGNSVVNLLRSTLKALNLGDQNLAKEVVRSDDVVDALYAQIVQDMLSNMQGSDTEVNFGNIMMAKNLERIGDHCTNIAEDVIYVHTGLIIRHLHAL